MRRNSLKILIIMSLFCIICLMLVAYAMCSIVSEIYDSEPTLRYKRLTLVLGALNVCPSICALIAIIKHAVAMIRKGDFVNSARRLFTLLQIAFYLQAGFTFVSVNSIGILENAGPPFIFVITIFIVSVSLTLALLFGSLKGMMNDSCASAS